MNNKATIVLLACTIAIFAVIGIGFLSSNKNEPKPAPTVKQSESSEKLPTRSELETLLTSETPAIQRAITATFPTLEQNYTIERSALYNTGDWYGTILQYKGSDVNNRDTLRIVLQKKNGEWVVRTPQPQPLVSHLELTDAPKGMLDDLNKPAPLAGTPTSPAITPSE